MSNVLDKFSYLIQSFPIRNIDSLSMSEDRSNWIAITISTLNDKGMIECLEGSKTILY